MSDRSPASSLPVPVAGLVPHAGHMCLLDRVVACSEEAITCVAVGHRDPTNPLREGERLPALAAIEYAAQAMAAHGALVAGAEPAKPGLLASARGVTLAVDRLDTIEDDLVITARAQSRDARTLLYDFDISAAGRPVARGRITVVLQP